ncbi:MAG: hypothetical protein ACRC2S_28475 [Waterburya sp.]
MEYTFIRQGYLCVPYTQLVKRFGEMKQIEDYDGWEIELNGLPIEIVTFDFEEPETETAFSVYSHHIASLELLAQEFGVNALSNIRPVQINQLAA